MTKPISLELFLSACRASVREDEARMLSEDTWVWKDMLLAGDDWWEFSVRVLEHLNCEAEMEIDIYNYIPHEGNVPVMPGFRHRTKDQFPDLTLKEVYQFCTFKEMSK